MRFLDQTVVVTGAGSGIGREMAKAFAAEGGAVVVADISGTAAEEVAAEIRTSDGQALATHTDVSVAADAAAMLAAAQEAFGPVDVLVNSAAIAGDDGLLRIEEDMWDRVFAVNLKGPFLCARAVLPGMIQRRRGAIVNISSINALAYFRLEAYSAAKAGLLSLTQSIAVRYGRYGVRANAIAPGTIRTPAWKKRAEKEPGIFERLGGLYPLGRVGEAGDVVSATLFLASSEASWITGTVLRVDGGLLSGSNRVVREFAGELDEDSE